ncbi:MAG: hypothetical protein GYA23_07210 [Methanomicrobiales archaeon]|nr:hypothetical protein [Methanomicrobiales archaeon]
MVSDRVKRGIVIILEIILAYFLANAVTIALLFPFRMDSAVKAVAGFLIFAITFVVITTLFERITGFSLFAFSDDA